MHFQDNLPKHAHIWILKIGQNKDIHVQNTNKTDRNKQYQNPILNPIPNPIPDPIPNLMGVKWAQPGSRKRFVAHVRTKLCV